MLQLGLIFALAAVFFILERTVPGRELPATPGWYARAVLLNSFQLGIVVRWSRRGVRPRLEALAGR